jgi:hypothetical protein
MSKLEPLQLPMRTLNDIRGSGSPDHWRGEHGVMRPIDRSWPIRSDSKLAQHGQCWAEVRMRGSSDYAPVFEGCKNIARAGFLTCRVHPDRELASRQLKCEVEGLQMADIAYADDQQKVAEAQLRIAAGLLRRSGTAVVNRRVDVEGWRTEDVSRFVNYVIVGLDSHNLRLVGIRCDPTTFAKFGIPFEHPHNSGKYQGISVVICENPPFDDFIQIEFETTVR